MCAVACGAISVGAQPRADVSLVPGRNFTKVFPCSIYSGVTSYSRIFFFIRLYNFWALPWGGRGSCITAESPAARPQEFLWCFMALECLQTVLPARA